MKKTKALSQGLKAPIALMLVIALLLTCGATSPPTAEAKEPPVVTHIGAMSIEWALTYSETYWRGVLPRGGESIELYYGNNQPEWVKAVDYLGEIAKEFTRETGHSLETHNARQVAQKLYEWSLANPQKFLFTATWTVKDNDGQRNYASFSRQSPLYDNAHIYGKWGNGTAGQCGQVTRWQVALLQHLGIYALLLTADFVQYDDFDAHALTGFYDPGSKKWYAYDFQNDGVFKGKTQLYDSPRSIYQNTNCIVVQADLYTGPQTDLVEVDKNGIAMGYKRPDSQTIGDWKFGQYLAPGKDRFDDSWIYQLPHVEKRNVEQDAWRMRAEALAKPQRQLFRPNQILNRGEAILMIMDYMFQPHYREFNMPFTDVSRTDCRAFFIALAVEKGVVTVGSDKRFKPNQRITRAEFAVMMNRAAEAVKKDGYNVISRKQTSMKKQGGLKTVPADSSISGETRTALRLMTSLDVLRPVRGQLQPDGTITKATAAVALVRLFSDSSLE